MGEYELSATRNKNFYFENLMAGRKRLRVLCAFFRANTKVLSMGSMAKISNVDIRTVYNIVHSLMREDILRLIDKKPKFYELLVPDDKFQKISEVVLAIDDPIDEQLDGGIDDDRTVNNDMRTSEGQSVDPTGLLRPDSKD